MLLQGTYKGVYMLAGAEAFQSVRRKGVEWQQRNWTPILTIIFSFLDAWAAQ